ncbi:MAG: hypothetical protein NWF01_06650 [Candidatus Bathyarchaeota archaeon]|nr:hypothetical protein [Candidatus Bathyarchaeota archaeon]
MAGLQFELPSHQFWDLDAVASLKGRFEGDFWVGGKLFFTFPSQTFPDACNRLATFKDAICH